MKSGTYCRFLTLLLAVTLLFAVPVTASEEDVVIVLDPGHGGLDTGITVKYDGAEVEESALVLKIAESCRDYLMEHYENVRVHLTRDTDKKVTLDERVQLAAELEADYMLSIHINGDDGYARGALRRHRAGPGWTTG